MNESLGNSTNRTKINATDDILRLVNSNFVNTANNEFFNTVNKKFLDETKSPSQLNEHEVNTNVTDIDFTVNCSAKSTHRVISNTDNTSDEEVLSENYLENVMQEFKTLTANVEDFQNKNRENFDTKIISRYLNMPWKMNFQICFLPFLILKFGRKELF